MNLTSLIIAVLVCSGCASADSASLIVHTDRVTARVSERVTLAELERRIAWQKSEAAHEKEANTRGEVYLVPFFIPRLPSDAQLTEMKTVFRPCDEIWSFHSIDGGWVVVRNSTIVYQCITTRESKRPNQSPEPTPPAGTSAAEQPLVPAAVVAHL